MEVNNPKALFRGGDHRFLEDTPGGCWSILKAPVCHPTQVMEIFETRRHQSNQNNACMECNACVARCMLQCDAMFCHGVLYVVFGLCIYAMIFIEGEPMGQGIPDDHPPVKGLIISNPTFDSSCLYNVIHPMKYPHQYPMKSLNPPVLWCFFELT